ncbi:MAG: ATP-binding protein [Geobacteraceae bacterium]
MGIDKDKNQSTAAELRRHAEERLQAKTGEVRPPPTEEEAQRLVHELEVHQIELEMQNAELRQTRDKMETALEKYTDLYDFAPIGYFTLDRNGAISSVNLSGASLLGGERARLLGRRFGLFVADETRPVFTEFLGKVFARRGKESCEVTLTKEGNHPLFVQIEAVTASSGQECHAAIMDISVRRQLEEKLRILHADLSARAAELESSNIELEAFNYTVSHDLRKPLTVIHGYCEVVKELCGNRLNDECNEYIQSIIEGTLRMNRLIDTLLDFSHITRIEMHHENVDLSKIAHELALELKVSTPERRGSFRIAEGIVAHGDTALLRVVLNNLIANAWKYASSREEAVIEFGVTEVEGKPAFFVRDNGPGFDMAFADKIFVPFQRLPGNSAEGYGIGLATVHRIIQRHGGRVWAEGKPGQGATFYFTL